MCGTWYVVPGIWYVHSSIPGVCGMRHVVCDAVFITLRIDRQSIPT